jgi:hypothetical protein
VVALVVVTLLLLATLAALAYVLVYGRPPSF